MMRGVPFPVQVGMCCFAAVRMLLIDPEGTFPSGSEPESLLHISGCLPKPHSTRCSLLESPSFPKGNNMERPTHENRNYQAQSIASRRRASGVRPLGLARPGRQRRPSVLRDKSRRAALRSQIPRSRFGRQAPAHNVQVRPCISQGFGCMPCKKRSGLSGPMGISSKLIICALPKGSFSSIS
jgi:hypothetical protein